MLTNLFPVPVLGSLFGLIEEFQQQRLSVFAVMFAIGFGVAFALAVFSSKSNKANIEQKHKSDKS